MIDSALQYYACVMLLLMLVPPGEASTLCSHCSNGVLTETPSDICVPDYLPQFPPDILFSVLLGRAINITYRIDIKMTSPLYLKSSHKQLDGLLAVYWKTPTLIIGSGPPWIIQTTNSNCENELDGTKIDVTSTRLDMKQCIPGMYTLITLQCEDTQCFHEGQMFMVSCKSLQTPVVSQSGVIGLLLGGLGCAAIILVLFFCLIRRHRLKLKWRTCESELNGNSSHGYLRETQQELKPDGNFTNRFSFQDGGLEGDRSSGKSFGKCRSGSSGDRRSGEIGRGKEDRIREEYYNIDDRGVNRQTSTKSSLQLLDIDTSKLVAVYSNGMTDGCDSEKDIGIWNQNSKPGRRDDDPLERSSSGSEASVEVSGEVQDATGLPGDRTSNSKFERPESDSHNIILLTGSWNQNDEGASDWV